MKVYKPEPTKFVRLMITQQGFKSEYVNLVDCSMKEVDYFLRELIEKQSISPFLMGKKTSIVIREAVGGKNGKSQSLSFRGLNPKQTSNLILKSLDKHQS